MQQEYKERRLCSLYFWVTRHEHKLQMSCKTCKKKTFKLEQGALTAARITRVLPKRLLVKVMCVASRQQSLLAQDEEETKALRVCLIYVVFTRPVFRIQPLSEALDDLFKEFNALKTRLGDLTDKFTAIETFIDEVKTSRATSSNANTNPNPNTSASTNPNTGTAVAPVVRQRRVMRKKAPASS